ncbi:MAG TPA: arsenite efflux transporter metallochaperone ArsD [Solirubrobacteraceae bacterium]|jgi:ubiquinone/menaquinone biosynthesis C-methylase UbiE|nr:arsenite efflux transporter metallochaperone ArsD [Solirubrobacteraceae bacterium]
MAELTSDPGAATAPTSSCCSTEAQATCCEPSEKASCCGETTAESSSCGCSSGQAEAPAAEDIRETVRERYAKAARAVATGGPGSCGCSTLSTTDEAGNEVFGAGLYDASQAEGATATAVAASLGCGVPTAVADLHEGETVLDLGSGAGADVLISARRVGSTGRAIGLDMTDEMLKLAHANAAEAGVTNVEFVKGYLEDIPLAEASVDVVVSNCVLNLSGDKPKVLAEAARVLKPGGRFAVSDVIAAPDMDEVTKADMEQWTGCIAGALTEEEFRDGLQAAGFTDIDIRKTHQVHEHASSAIIRARKPDAPAVAHRVELYEPAMCCQTGVCGPSLDQQLVDVREDLRWFEAQGAQVARHNLSSDPDAFVANPKVTGLMTAFGEAALPVLVVDGDIAIHGRYPSREDLAAVLSVKAGSVIELSQTSGGCGCGPGGC